jgi:hypothetical protein
MVSTALPTVEQLTAWRAEHARAMRRRAELDEYIDDLAKMIELGAKLVTKPSGEGPKNRKAFGGRAAAREKARATLGPKDPPEMRSGSWTEAIWHIVVAEDRLMTMEELRTELAKVRPVDSVWTGGVQRLRDTGHLVSYKGRVGTNAALDRFLADVAASKISRSVGTARNGAMLYARSWKTIRRMYPQ